MTRLPGPFYLVVVLWGVEHRNYFLRFLVPSLLSPGNLPSLQPGAQHRFLIATTIEDWTMIQTHPAYQKLARTIEPVFLEIPAPAEGANKYLVMSSGHKIAAKKAFVDKAYGVFLTPDLVLSEGSIAGLQRLALAGKKVVLCAAMRFTMEGCIPEIEALRGTSPEDPLVLPPRTLAALALRNMHCETLRYDWDAPFFADRPFNCFWRVPGEQGIVIHSLSWAPLLVSYAGLSEHHTETFDHWTMDGDYIYQNFPDERDIHVVRDSDEILLVSFTGADERPGHLAPDVLAPRWYNTWPFIGRLWKIHLVRTVTTSGMDPLKLRIFPLAVRMHRGVLNSAAWKKTEERAAKIIARAGAPATLFEKICARLIQYVKEGKVWPFSALFNAETIEVYATATNFEFANQSGVGSYRGWLVSSSKASGRWYWEIFSPNLGAGRGAIADTVTVGVLTSQHSIVKELGSGKAGWGWRGDGTAIHAGRRVPYGSAAEGNDEIIMIALDADAGKVWFGRNGTWFGDSDPGTGAYPAFDEVKGTLFPALSSKHGGRGTAILHARVTSDSWTYAPPRGFYPLTLAEFQQRQEAGSSSLTNTDNYVRR